MEVDFFFWGRGFPPSFQKYMIYDNVLKSGGGRDGTLDCKLFSLFEDLSLWVFLLYLDWLVQTSAVLSNNCIYVRDNLVYHH